TRLPHNLSLLHPSMIEFSATAWHKLTMTCSHPGDSASLPLTILCAVMMSISVVLRSDDRHQPGKPVGSSTLRGLRRRGSLALYCIRWQAPHKGQLRRGS